MIEMCDLLIKHAADPDRLASDPVIQAAAQRWIEILGEAASRLADEIKFAHPEVPWRDIVGTRVILAHTYFQIDPAIVRHVISAEVPRLRHHLGAIVTLIDSDDD
jgi:uncharacterized protein with HEPN domain